MPTARRHLLLVTQRPLEYGGGGSIRWRFLCDELPRHGWDVSVVSARQHRTANEISTDRSEARLAAARTRVMGVARVGLEPLARAARVQPEAFAPNNAWAWTGRRAIRDAIAQRRPDVLVATAPPASALLAAAAVAREHDLPLVADLRDLWAGNPYLDRGSELLRRIEARAFRRARAIVTVTDGFRERLGELHPEAAERLTVIPNGFDPALLAKRNHGAQSQGQRPVLVHAGSLYGDRSAAELIAALGRAELARPVTLRLIGTVDPASAAAARHAPDGVQVRIEPPVTWAEAVEAMVAADIAVVLNTPGIGGDRMVPGKLYEALALGRPILAVTPRSSEVSRLLDRLGQSAGVAAVGDPAAIATAARRLLDAPPPPVPPEGLATWDRARGAERLAELLERVASGARGLG